jgi:hypothetical protein
MTNDEGMTKIIHGSFPHLSILVCFVIRALSLILTFVSVKRRYYL